MSVEAIPEKQAQSARSLWRLVQRHGRQRIDARKEEERKWHSSDASMRRLLRKNFPMGMTFERARFRVGTVVEGTMWPGLYLVVGHGFTGSHGQERGCHGCKITDRIHQRPQWIGPDKKIKPVPLNTEISQRRGQSPIQNP